MFGIFKKLFGKENPAETSAHPFVPPQRGTRPVSGLPSRPSVRPDNTQPGPARPARQTRPAPGFDNVSSTQTSFSARRIPPAIQPATESAVDSGETIALPLQSILNNLPTELQCRVAQNVPDYVEVSFSRDRILSQLTTGSVKFTFGELRLVAPHGTLMPQNDRDHMPIELPLADVLARVNPAALPRRNGQKKICVPDEIAGPFGNQCEGVTIATKPGRPAPAAGTAPAAKPDTTPPIPVVSSAPRAPVEQPPIPIESAAPATPEPSHIPTPRIPGAPTVRLQTHAKPAPAVSEPGQNNNGRKDGTTTRFVRPPQKSIIKIVPPPSAKARPATAAPTPAIPAPSIPAPLIPAPRFAENPPPVAPAVPAAAPAPIEPASVARPAMPGPPPMPSAPFSGAIITMPIAELWHNWPDAVKDEIAQLGLMDAKVSVPLELIEAALKQGRVSFSWRLLRSWVRPTAPFQAQSPHEGAILDLPLKVVAPAFLSRHRDTTERKRVELAADIPDLWSGGKKLSSDTTVTRPKTTIPDQTNYYVWSDGDDRPVVESVPETAPVRSAGSGADTNFMSRFSTPHEVVHKAAAVQGVAGALVALEDGLLVASKLTPDVNGDTLAAFIPQAFIRVSQTTRELMMGELNNLNFTLGTTPWKIFRVGSLYFAVYGRPGEPLPTAQVAGLAAELERKPR